MGKWDYDGSTGDPRADIEAFAELGRRNANAPPAPWFVGTIKGLRDRLRMIAAAFPNACSFVSLCRELLPASIRREVLRSEIERRKR